MHSNQPGHTPDQLPEQVVPEEKPRRGRKKAGVVKSRYEEMLLDLVQKDYVLFAPKSKRGLKFDYPELADKDKSPEFVGVRENDMLFVWAWACASSPFVSIEPREKKMELCCRYAYPIEQWERKCKDYELHFPDDVSRALEKMAKYNVAARVEEYVALKIARDNYKHILAQDISKAAGWQQKEWADLSIIATKGLAVQRDRAEGFSLGVEEASNTLIQQAVDLLSMHHNRN